MQCRVQGCHGYAGGLSVLSIGCTGLPARASSACPWHPADFAMIDRQSKLTVVALPFFGLHAEPLASEHYAPKIFNCQRALTFFWKKESKQRKPIYRFAYARGVAPLSSISCPVLGWHGQLACPCPIRGKRPYRGVPKKLKSAWLLISLRDASCCLRMS